MSDTRSRRLQKELGMARREKEYVKEVTLVDGDVGKWQGNLWTFRVLSRISVLGSTQLAQYARLHGTSYS